MKNKLIVFLLFLTLSLGAVSHSHLGSVNEILPVGSNTFYTCGDDGAVVFWQGSTNERLQVSDIPIKNIAYNSNLKYIAVYESDGFSLHRITVWDWNQKKRLYAKRFSDRVVFLDFSTKGTYLMVGTESLNSLNFFNSKTGEQIQILENPSSLISFALTGASDTTLAAYSTTGNIYYYDLNSGEVKHKFSTETGLQNPVIHKNNLMLTGLIDDACITLDMTNGKQLNSLQLPPEGENTSVSVTANPKDEEPTIFIQSGNNLKIKTYSSDIFDIELSEKFRIKDAKIKDNYFYISTDDGRIYSISKLTTPPELTLIGENSVLNINDICALNDKSGNSIVVTENGIYKLLSPLESPVKISEQTAFTNCDSFLDGYILWNEDSVLYIDNLNNEKQIYKTNNIITSVSTYENLISVIENGSILKIFTNEGTPVFNYSGAGFIDTVFYDSETIYITKTSSNSMNPPLIKVSVKTGEVVPVQQIEGIMLYELTQPQNNISYGLLVSAKNGASGTELIKFDYLENKKTTLANYPDENSNAFISIIDDIIYTNLGKTNVIGINTKMNRQLLLDKKNTLPEKIIDGKDYLIALNFDSSISYYSKRTLKPISQFQLDKNQNWNMKRIN